MGTNSKHTEGKVNNNLKDGNVYDSAGIVVANCYSSLLMPATIKANAKRIETMWNNWDEATKVMEGISEAFRYSQVKGEEQLTALNNLYDLLSKLSS